MEIVVEEKEEETFGIEKKKLTPAEQIEHDMREMQEVIAFLDYSFERAFTVQEKEYIMSYKVSFS